MAEPGDDDLIQVLRELPGQPIPGPAQTKAWDVPRVISAAVDSLGGERQAVEELLDRLVVRLGGGRRDDVIRHSGDLAHRAGSVMDIRETYWVDENMLDPSRRPREQGWHDPT